MIDISCKIYLQKKDVAYTYYISLVETITGHQKLRLTYRELPAEALSDHVKIYNVRNNYWC